MNRHCFNVATAVLTAAFLFSIFVFSIKPPVEADSQAVLIDAVYYDGQLSREPDEAVRLVNQSEEPVDIGGWSLNDALEDTSRLVFPAGATIPPGERIWIAREAAPFRVSFGFSPTWRAADLTGAWIGLANSGDEVVLRNDQGHLVDVVVFGSSPAGQTTIAWQGDGLKPYKIHHGTAIEGQILYRKPSPTTGLPVPDTDTAADWAQDPTDSVWGRKVQYPGWQPILFSQTVQLTSTAVLTIAAAPDNAFEFLAHMIDGAQEKIVGEYHTFDNPAVADKLVQAAERGVSITLLLEGGPPGGVSDQAKLNCQKVAQAGGACWVMISDNGSDISDRYDYIHSKFMIVDGRQVIIGSENLSPNSLPPDPKGDGTWGRRGVLLGIESTEVAEALESIWSADFAPQIFQDIQPIAVLGGPDPGYIPPPPQNPTTYTVQMTQPAVLTGNFPIEILVSPENSLRPDSGILALIGRAGAGDTILSQQLAERPVWDPADHDGENVRLAALVEAARRGATVRIMLDQFFDQPGQPLSNSATCLYLEHLSRKEYLDLRCQVQNPSGLGIHNKMMVFFIEDQGFIQVGSINGTEQSFKANREVGIILQSDAAAHVLAEMFWRDWRFKLFLPQIFAEFRGPAHHLLIGEIYPNPFGATDAAEFIELVNPTPRPIDLSGFSVSDGIRPEDFADLKRFPAGTILLSGEIIVVAQQGSHFQSQFGFLPDFEILDSMPQLPNLIDDPVWGNPNQFLRLGNQGDVVILRDRADQIVDFVAYGSGQMPGADSCELPPSGHSLVRTPYWRDTGICKNDFDIWPIPNPGEVSK